MPGVCWAPLLLGCTRKRRPGEEAPAATPGAAQAPTPGVPMQGAAPAAPALAVPGIGQAPSLAVAAAAVSPAGAAAASGIPVPTPAAAVAGAATIATPYAAFAHAPVSAATAAEATAVAPQSTALGATYAGSCPCRRRGWCRLEPAQGLRCRLPEHFNTVRRPRPTSCHVATLAGQLPYARLQSSTHPHPGELHTYTHATELPAHTLPCFFCRALPVCWDWDSVEAISCLPGCAHKMPRKLLGRRRVRQRAGPCLGRGSRGQQMRLPATPARNRWAGKCRTGPIA